MKENIDSIIQWHKETFHNVTRGEQARKFLDEIEEYRNAVKNETHEDILMEAVDTFISALGLFRLDINAGLEALIRVRDNRLFHYEIDIEDFEKAIDKKMEINRNRKFLNNQHIG